MKILKRIGITVVVFNICVLVLRFFVFRMYIIKGLYSTHFICSIGISVAFLIILLIIEKMYSKHKLLITLVTIGISVFTLLCSYVVLEMRPYLIDDQKFYSIDIEGLSDENQISLYEYDGFLEKRGCLCIKINDYIYKGIYGTSYRIEGGYSLTNPNSLILDYNPEEGTLNMKYRINENEKYIEKTIPLKK